MSTKALSASISRGRSGVFFVFVCTVFAKLHGSSTYLPAGYSAHKRAREAGILKLPEMLFANVRSLFLPVLGSLTHCDNQTLQDAAELVTKSSRPQLIILMKKIVFNILHSYRLVQKNFSIRVYAVALSASY